MSFNEQDLRLMQDAITYFREHGSCLAETEHRLDILYFKLQYSILGI